MNLGRFITRLFALFGISLTTVACYGTPYEEYHGEWGVNGRVVDAEGTAIEGIEVSRADAKCITDAEGYFYVGGVGSELMLRDTDGEMNGGKFLTRRIILLDGEACNMGDVVMQRETDINEE